MAKNDRRVKYTKMVLKNALIELMQEKPIAKINIKEICERADINRGTFYSHYIDQFDLQKQIFDELVNGIDQMIDSSILTMNTERSGRLLTSVFSYLQENKQLVSVLMSENSTIDIQAEVFRFLKEKNLLKPITPHTKTLDYLYAFMASGCVEMVREWLNSGTETPEDIARYVALFITQGAIGVIRKNG